MAKWAISASEWLPEWAKEKVKGSSSRWLTAPFLRSHAPALECIRYTCKPGMDSHGGSWEPGSAIGFREVSHRTLIGDVGINLTTGKSHEVFPDCHTESYRD